MSAQYVNTDLAGAIRAWKDDTGIVQFSTNSGEQWQAAPFECPSGRDGVVIVPSFLYDNANIRFRLLVTEPKTCVEVAERILRKQRSHIDDTLVVVAEACVRRALARAKWLIESTSQPTSKDLEQVEKEMCQ